VQLQRFLMLTRLVQGIDMRDGFGEDVGEGGDAAGRPDG
jgi:hypothetical protein